MCVMASDTAMYVRFRLCLKNVDCDKKKQLQLCSVGFDPLAIDLYTLWVSIKYVHSRGRGYPKRTQAHRGQ